MNAFANALLDSSRAARAEGPQSRWPAAAKRSATPKLNGNSGPTTVRSMFSRWARARRALGWLKSAGRVCTRGPMRGFPGAANAWISRSRDCAGPAGFGGQPRNQGVLARAAAEDENLHCLNDLWCVL